MFNTPAISTMTVVKFKSDEIHIVGKGCEMPEAFLSFLPIDINGDVVPYVPVINVHLVGIAYNLWYQNWTSESDIYTQILSLLKSNVAGITIDGLDMTKIGTYDNINLDMVTNEVLNNRQV